MKNDAVRIASYLAKTVPGTVSLKVASQLAGMKTGFASALGGLTGLVAMEVLVQTQLNADGTIPTIDYPFYMNFGRETWKRQKEGIDGPALLLVAQSLHDKYVAYGLDTAVLVTIADNVFGLTVT